MGDVYLRVKSEKENGKLKMENGKWIIDFF